MKTINHNQNIRKRTHCTGYVLSMMLITLLSISSCGKGGKSAKLAKEANGVWTTGEIQLKNGSGEKLRSCITYALNYDSVSSKKGGTFKEERYMKLSGEKEYIVFKGIVNTSVEGAWEIADGGLKLTYDLPTLEASVIYSPDINLGDDADSWTRERWEEADQDDLKEWREMLNFSSLTKETQSTYYKELYAQYEENNEKKEVFSNLQITADTILFETPNEGELTLTRTTEQAVSELNEKNYNAYKFSHQTKEAKLKKNELPQMYHKNITGYTCYTTSFFGRANNGYRLGNWTPSKPLKEKIDVNLSKKIVKFEKEEITIRIISWDGLSYGKDGSTYSVFTVTESLAGTNGKIAFIKHSDESLQLYFIFGDIAEGYYDLSEIIPYK